MARCSCWAPSAPFTLQRILSLSFHHGSTRRGPTFLGNPRYEVEIPYVDAWFGEAAGQWIVDWSVPLSILFAIPIMALIGLVMERGLIKHFYKRPHADQILVTFGLAIVLQEIIKYLLWRQPDPDPGAGRVQRLFRFRRLLGFDANTIIYPYWRLVYFLFAAVIVAAVFAFLQFTTFGMVVRAGMADRETVGLLGINIDRRFTIMFAIAAVVAGLAGVMYTPINSPQLPHGHGLPRAQLRRGRGRRHGLAAGRGAGRLPAGHPARALPRCAGARASFPGINQIIIYLVAIIILLTRPRGLMGRKGVMEE
jgi:branched-chain amino acid transport system permease protein